MLVENVEKNTRKFIMAERCTFLPAENNDKYLICNRGLRKWEKVKKILSKGWGNLIAIWKSWTKVKIRINAE